MSEQLTQQLETVRLRELAPETPLRIYLVDGSEFETTVIDPEPGRVLIKSGLTDALSGFPDNRETLAILGSYDRETTEVDWGVVARGGLLAIKRQRDQRLMLMCESVMQVVVF